MGNTVSRSHIRDADRGVAKATRANTKRNTNAFTTADLPSSSSALTLHPSPVSILHLAPPPPVHAPRQSPHSRLPHPHDHTLAFSDPSPPPAANSPQDNSHPTPLTRKHDLQRHTSAPDHFDHPPPCSENDHTFTYGSTHAASENSYLAPDPVPPDQSHLSPPPRQNGKLQPSPKSSENPSSPAQPPSSSTAVSSSVLPASPAIEEAPHPRRRERHPANISFSRNGTSQATSAKRPPLSPDAAPAPTDEDRIEPLNDTARNTSSASSARRSSPFSQRVVANIDPNLPGATVRDCHTARTETPPRVDKPPRARKVVSFNENVHVVTYPNEGSSSHSSSGGDLPPRYPEGKATRRRTRSVFRLLSRVAGPILQPEQTHYSELSSNTSCFSSQTDACCGLRLGGSTEEVYDDHSPNRKLARAAVEKTIGERHPAEFGDSKDLYNGSDLVVSYEKARQTVDLLKSEPSRPGVKVRTDTIVDDFDYNERRLSDDDDTLSLSDAHPSRDGIDEPEAIGDQLLSPGKEVRDSPTINSAFNIVPLWQRLKRVDELDVMLPAKTAVVAAMAELNESTGVDCIESESQESSGKASEEGEQDTVEAAARTNQVDHKTPVDHSLPILEKQDLLSGVRDEKAEAIIEDHAVATTPVSEAGRDDDGVDGEQEIPALATVMYTSSSGLDLGPSSGPLSVADPASDVDALLPAHQARVEHISESTPTEKLDERDCEPLQGLHKIDSRMLLPAEKAARRNASDDHSILSGGSLPDAEISISRSSESAIASGMEVRSFEPVEEKNNVDDVQAGILEVSGIEELKPVRSELSLLPGDDTSEASTYEETNVMRSEGEDSTHLPLNAPSSATVEDEGTKDSIVGLDLDPLILPSHDDYSVAPCSPALSPLAGVFYGAESPANDMNKVGTNLRGVNGLADYPEYAVLKNQGNEDSLFGSEPNTPVLRSASGWNEPFNDFELGDRVRGARLPLRHVNFEDRRNRQAVPEVLLHDWSGSIPVEPNVDIVDSAPNSRSSSTYNHIINPRFRDQQWEFPNAAALLSSRLNVDMSRVYAASSGRSSIEVPSHGEARSGNNITAMVSKESTRVKVVGSSEPQSGKDRDQRDLRPNEAPSSGSEIAWVSSDYEDHSQKETKGVKETLSGPFFKSIPGMHPRDPKLQDFQISVNRKSFSDGHRRPPRTNRGRSFAEPEQAFERSGEPSSDFRTISREAYIHSAIPSRLTAPQRRRRLSNLEMSSTDRDESNNNPFRTVMGRLASGVHRAKRLVSQN